MYYLWASLYLLASPPFLLAVGFVSLITSEGNFDVFKREFMRGIKFFVPPMYSLITYKERRAKEFVKKVKTI